MSADGSGELVGAAIEASKAVIEPMFDDAVRPVAKQVGKSLELGGRAINLALGPLEILIVGGEQLRDYIKERMTEKLGHLPKGRIQAADPNIAVPAITALMGAVDHPELREMFINLLAAASDRDRASLLHPRYVEIIRQLSPAEARLFQILGSDPDAILWVELEFQSVPDGRKGRYGWTSPPGKDTITLQAEFENLESLGIIKPHNCAVEGIFSHQGLSLENEHKGAWVECFKMEAMQELRSRVQDGSRYTGRVMLARLNGLGKGLHMAVVD